MNAAATSSRIGLRLIADDLTGALDTAAEFVPVQGPVRVVWGRPRPVGGDAVAFDVASREQSEATAARLVTQAVADLGFADAALPYLKVDSLLRGHAGAELAACLATGAFTHTILAPAFPFQNRRTRRGRQWAPIDGTWQPIGEDPRATLTARGIAVTSARPGEAIRPGVTLFDAETDADLAVIVAEAQALSDARILWCGSGGLAGALAGRAATPLASTTPTLSAPLLGLFGTDHPVTAAQLARAGDWTLLLPDGSVASAERLTARLERTGGALVAFDLPRLDRGEAARRIAHEMDRLVSLIAPPASLVCGGGETLRAVCDALGAEGLDVYGRIVPGVPRARIVGGRWDGVDVVSKSGAFGDPDFLARLVAPSARPGGTVLERSTVEG